MEINNKKIIDYKFLFLITLAIINIWSIFNFIMLLYINYSLLSITGLIISSIGLGGALILLVDSFN